MHNFNQKYLHRQVYQLSTKFHDTGVEILKLMFSHRLMIFTAIGICGPFYLGIWQIFHERAELAEWSFLAAGIGSIPMCAILVAYALSMVVSLLCGLACLLTFATSIYSRYMFCRDHPELVPTTVLLICGYALILIIGPIYWVYILISDFDEVLVSNVAV